ncbi:uncharacterized protein HMPREF1541_08688 [Cyphellophora europaea CBS 101466]|uniref:Non-specific serine/threonine protein kinase n=1 Tax=Cyphellophora europaea (strain CBS 101466) TaxID=1220924 RepID=W2RIY3_CYPE1|nr:uncharacterized protein HMPREF1541_08688 [Cyphellophora europaea CBS 101466]ETN36411.1 hypothetical protein HMPREF1541_08688 [Cyphellophora europaea CBS 101466]
MDAAQKIDIYAARLGDPKLDVRAKANIATEVRDSIESLCTPAATYQKFLSKLWPVFKKVLEGKPDFHPASSEHTLRNQILEILHRLQHASPEVEPFAVEMVDLLMDLVRVENEDNAVLCLKTVMDLERHQPVATQSKVQPFLDLIQEMFETMEQVVKDTFDNPTAPAGAASSTPNAQAGSLQSPRPGSPATTVSDPGMEKKEMTPLVKGMQSFKVLSECPIIVVSIFQAHRSSVPMNVKKFVPSIKGILLLQAKTQKKAHEDAAERKTIFTGVSKEIKNRAAFGDFITAQVKTMSFLAYLLRVYANQLSDFLPTLPVVVVRLLKDCPGEKSSARKELLVAIRHIINFNYRKIFLNKIDELLDDRILIGDGLTVYESMRPLAYSMLADLIHHVRESLSRDQIRKTIEVYTRNLHDSFPGTSFQTMSAKLLLNMAESITKLEDKADARHFLVMILDAIGDKFAAMNYQYTNAVKLSKLYADKSKDTQAESYMDEKDQVPDWDEVDIFSATPIKTSNPRDRGADPVADNKFLFKNLVNGLKNMFYQLKNCNPPSANIDPANTPSNWGEISFGYDAEEVKVVTKLFHEGARVFRYYGTDSSATELPASSPIDSMASHSMAQMSREEKELLESFGTVFHCLDPATFHEVFQSEIPHLHELMFEHTALLHLPQFFLASETTSPAFAGMVIQYLMNKLPEVGASDVKKSSILLRMFKLSFMAVTLFSQHNEQVLHPHITKIVTQCVQLSVSAEKPIHYFILLRSLFRSIGGGRFELLYKEILPLLEMLLETFNHLLQGARDLHDRDLYVELTLTVPARLSHLLPHLSHLMRPLVVALRAGPDLVSQGLRTLELCVDNLTADYLDPIMAPIMDDLMTALFEHLKPQPYQHFHSHTTMRILGKLGGRNRKFLNHPHQLPPRDCTDDEPSFDIRLIGTSKDRAFPLNAGVDLAIKKLSETNRPSNAKGQSLDLYYKQQSFKFISNQVKLFIGYDHLPEDFAALLRLQANDLAANRFETYAEMLSSQDTVKSVQKRRDEEENLKKLLKACFVATTVPELKDAAEDFITNVARHFTIIELGQALCDAGRRTKPFDVNSGEGAVYLSTRLLADVLVDCFASDNAVVREAAEAAMFTVRDTSRAIFGQADKAAKFPFFYHMTQTFCHKCREVEWFTKAGAALGLQIIVTKLDLGNMFLSRRHLDIVKALLFVIKDTPQDVPASTRITAQETLEFILKKICSGLNKESISNDKGFAHALSVHLSVELSHMNKHVRETAKHSFTVMADQIGVEVHELIAPVKERLLQPIFNKPLRALPFLSQTGFIDAVTYCLGLGHDLVPLNDQLNRLTMESLALADAESEILHPKPDEFSNAELIVNLRVSCLKLLSMAMALPEFGQNAAQHTSRARIITVFFKLLYSKSQEVIDAAYGGLKDVLAQTNKLPKDLLQNGLRPILMNLQDPKRLSVHGLDGLARLLTLLTNYFKVEIGSRLLEHMKVIAEDQLLQKVSFGMIEQNPQMKIVAAILNIFHLLPPTATTFMQELVNGVLDLESKLRRTTSSPFRQPLVLYLNKYPKESFGFFQGKMQEEKYGRFFAQILSDASSEPLREHVMAEVDSLSATFFDVTDQDAKNVAIINGIHVTAAICKSDKASEWIKTQLPFVKRLLENGKEIASKLRGDELQHSQRLRAEQAGDALMEILIAYMSANTEDLDFMVEVFTAAAEGAIKVPLCLNQFLCHKLITNDSATLQRSIIDRSLDLYTQKQPSQKLKTFLLHSLVNPIMAQDVQRTRLGKSREPVLMDKSMFDMIHEKLWKSPAEISDDQVQPGIDHSRMEVLQLSAFMIKYHKDSVSEARKDIIKFAWSYIRLEDVINKYAAYVLICYFIRSYETPTKIAAQIYNQLLKAHQNEGKTLVTQALEVLAPILPTRMAQPNATPGDKRSPTWARLPKKILNEETGNLQQVQSIFNFIVRQPDLFYESREFFVPTMIQMLHKIASPPNPSNESKKLALSLVTLIAQWEQRRVSPDSPSQSSSESPSLKRDAAGGQISTPDKNVRPEYVIPLDLRTMVIKYMITFITSLQERYPVPSADLKAKTMQKVPQMLPNDMCKKAVQLLHELLSPQLWADVDVGLYPKLLDPMLAGEKADKPDEKHLTCMINALQVMRILLSTKSDDWILSNMELIQKLVEKPLKADEPEIQDCIHWVDESLGSKPLLTQILEAIPESKADDEDAMELDGPPADFLAKFSKTLIGEGLSAMNLTSAVNNLWTLTKVRPVEVDEHIPGLMRVLQSKLAKDHISAFMIPTGPPPNGWRMGEPIMDPYEFAWGVDLMKKTIDILSARMSTLGDQRRPFLSVLASLVEKSYNAEICNKILDMVEAWVFNSNEAWPTLKEKTAVLHKMLIFERWPNQSLLERFLELVIKIYEDPTIARSELTVRLEHAFLIGTRAKDVEMRSRFMNIFTRALSETASYRMSYVLTVQNWDTLADSFWLKQASHLILGAVDMALPARLHPEDITICPVSQMFAASLVNPEQKKDDIMLEDSLEDLVAAQRKFNHEIQDVKVRDLLEPLTQLQHVDDQVAYDVWVKLFPLCWAALTRDERIDLEKGMVTLLTREYHQRQLNLRPNVVQALLEGVVRARPRFKLPPHVIKFVCRTHDAWYTGLTSLEESTINPLIDTAQVRESNLDALVEVYAGLQEDDLFYGTWRRRCKFMETNSALSYEQHGMWDKAQHLWEAAQVKARTGVMPFSQGEYYLWEDHWVICAQKLQQWDILGEFAKHENFQDLLLESAWRNYEAWGTEEARTQLDGMIKSVSDAPTPRRTFFQAFMALLKYNSKQISRVEFQHICDEATQLSIRKWHQLPSRITNAHIPILQQFQQLVELHDGSVICDSLMGTNERNLDSKSQEVKLLLQAWRDRLPNVWDDINAWQDLVTWRQHVFQLVNNTYLPLLPQGGNNVGNNSYAFRGYHETAWIINKFAHVARKHQMPEVCINQLGKIYTLPNIEIQEAFLKLREQAKCHYQNKSELNNGLDVINNTNLNYFGAQQKAEFYTLKGMFLAKLQHAEEANEAFGVALYYDLRLPKAWAEWGQYSDRKFKDNPGTIEAASNAVSCYLEAAGLYKSAKSRKMLSRVLWLLSLDDDEGQIAKAFEDFKGDTPVWYWTTFIPQLLGSLEHKEARLAKTVLAKIAKAFPQSLFYHLRATREDFLSKRKQQEMRSGSKPSGNAQTQEKSESSSRPGTANGETPTNGDAKPKEEPNDDNKEVPAKEAPKKPWEYANEVMDGLKTGFPLLALSMETMTDQLSKHFKCPPDEDAHRLIVALLNDGLTYINRAPANYAEGAKLPPSTEANISRFVASVLPAHIRGSFEADFVQTKPTMYEYIHKLRRWRDKFENKLDHRQQWAPLESYSHHLSEFKFLKFDESVEIPGQYQQHKDKNSDFVRIERFMPTVELVRGNNICHRRLTIRGHDGSLHPFAVQHPTGGKVRREERIVQLFRIFNQTLFKRKESRRRNLYFHLPIFVPIAPHIRLVQDDASYVTLQTIYEDYVRSVPDMSRDDPMLFLLEQSRTMVEQQKTNPRTPDQLVTMKTEIFNKIVEKWVPSTIALSYFQAIYPTFADFWLFRRQFSYQYATTAFMTYVMHMSSRYPMKLSISKATGDLWASDALPNLSAGKPVFYNPEAVPFRLTPNIQTLMGPLAVEGIFTASLMAVARGLSEADQGYEMAQQLSVFVRDEIYSWAAGRGSAVVAEMEGEKLREAVGQNSEFVVRRALALGKTQGNVGAGAGGEGGSGSQGVLPACQNVVDLISRATNPEKLAQLSAMDLPWL